MDYTGSDLVADDIIGGVQEVIGQTEGRQQQDNDGNSTLNRNLSLKQFAGGPKSEPGMTETSGASEEAGAAELGDVIELTALA